MTKDRFRVLVCGGRDYADEKRMYKVLDSVLAKYGDCLVIVHGSARGADLLAEKWAKDREVEYMGFPARWKRLGKAAGHERNKRQRDTAVPDACIAFPGGDGTDGMCRLMDEIQIMPWRIERAP